MKVRGVIFDLDGTLTPVRSVWQHIHEALGTWVTHGSVSLEAFLAGKISYQEFARRDVTAWSGVPKERIEKIVAEIPYRSGVRETVAALKQKGVKLALLSSGLDILATRVAEELGFNLCIANGLGFTDERINGQVQIQVPWDGKPMYLSTICGLFGTTPAETAAIGDSHGDVPLFERVGLGIAVNAEPEVSAFAHVSLQCEDLRALLPVLLPYLP
ncbi:MAG: HAD family phosphatase [Firmicutes bacterium]|nr:HAD family phosphatase [Bacillota bacterium]